MSFVFPVPTTRTSSLLQQSRLLGQVQNDQLDLFRLQTQISTGQRVTAPSEDAPASIRAMSLQRLLEQKAQSKTNLTTTQSYLTATDSAVQGVSNLLADIRGEVLSVAGNTGGHVQRQAVSQEVRRAIQQLADVGNQRFRGRYLFGGSKTTIPPFELADGFVKYEGNTQPLKSFGDVDFLFASNVNGDDLFGAISPQVRGRVDLNPVLTERTRLADLNGGRGVPEGSFLLSDGEASRTVDISGAATLGDVVRLIEGGSTLGPAVIARVTAQGLSIELDPNRTLPSDSGLPKNLSVREVGGGVTAGELGIHNPGGVGEATLIGDDLDPLVRRTTQLRDAFGVRASAAVRSDGFNNDVIVESKLRGDAFNGVTIQFVDDELLQAAPGVLAGDEFARYLETAQGAQAAVTFTGANNDLLLTANTPGTTLNNVEIEVVDGGAIGNAAQITFDSVAQRFSIGIDSAGATEVQTIIDEINNQGLFTANYDDSDAADGGFSPTAAISAADIGNVTGNTGNSGAEANTIQVHIRPGQTTAQQVVDAVNAGGNGVSDLFESRIDVKDADTPSSAGLGFVDVNETASLSGGQGVELDLENGLQIESGGETHVIDFQGAETVEDLLNILSGSTANVTAQINAQGNGIDIQSLLSGGNFHIGENGGLTATQLGVRSYGDDTLLADLNHGFGVHIADGADLIIERPDGVELEIDLDNAVTIRDVLDAINLHPDNQTPPNFGGGVIARLRAEGNGIELIVDPGDGSNPDPPPTNELILRKPTLSNAAWDLGLIPQGDLDLTSPEGRVIGKDTNPQEVKGVFNSLIRLREALDTSDLPQIQRAIAMLDDDIQRVNFSRAELGARQQGLDTLNHRLEDEQIELRSSLSQEIDVDLSEAISNLAARQAAFEASLQLMGRTYQLSLLQFL